MSRAVGRIPGNAFIDLCAENARRWTPDPARVQAIIDERQRRADVEFERSLRKNGFKRPGREKK